MKSLISLYIERPACQVLSPYVISFPAAKTTTGVCIPELSGAIEDFCFFNMVMVFNQCLSQYELKTSPSALNVLSTFGFIS